jgi:hypothetical protein
MNLFAFAIFGTSVHLQNMTPLDWGILIGVALVIGIVSKLFSK